MQAALRVGLSVPAIALAVLAFAQVARIAQADYAASQDTIPALERAARLVPANADTHARISDLDPARDEELQEAIALNSRVSPWWIARSVRQEQQGDLSGAESSLRKAVAVSRYYIPWWSLTAFYYRQKNTRDFLPAARETLSVGAGDLRSVFQMAKNLEIPDSVIQERLLPDLPDVLHAYLSMVLEAADLDAVVAVSHRLLKVGSVSRLDAVLAATEALYQAGRTNDAVTLWNGTIAAHWSTMNPLDPAAGASLTDGTFQNRRIQSGFAWKEIAPTAVSVTPGTPTGLRLEFDGRQPESCDLLSQNVPVLPGRRYQLKTRYRTQGIPPDSGLRWTIVPNRRSPSTLPSLSSEETAEQAGAFETPAQAGPLRLVLSYTRLPGTTRIQGKLWIESVQLELMNQESIKKVTR